MCWWLLINQIKSSQNQYLSSYLSSPWRPAALFDLPNHGGHQEQRQEAAVDGRRGTGESEKDIRVRFVAKKCTSMCISFSHTYIKQRALIFSFELMHIHVCFGPTAPARTGDYSPHWSALFLISNRSEASVSLPADTKVTSCCSVTISKKPLKSFWQPAPSVVFTHSKNITKRMRSYLNFRPVFWWHCKNEQSGMSLVYKTQGQSVRRWSSWWEVESCQKKEQQKGQLCFLHFPWDCQDVYTVVSCVDTTHTHLRTLTHPDASCNFIITYLFLDDSPPLSFDVN